MLVLPVIPIFCLVVVAVNTLLPVFQSIYAENTHFISKIAIKEFSTKRLFFVLLGLYFEYTHTENTGAPNENIVQNHINIALLNVL